MQLAYLDVLVRRSVLDGGQESGAGRAASHEGLGRNAGNRNDGGHGKVDVGIQTGSKEARNSSIKI